MASSVALTDRSASARRRGAGPALGGLAALLGAVVVTGLCAGRFAIAPMRSLEILTAFVVDPSRPIAAIDERIVLLVRSPRILLAALAGAGLAVSGVALQGVFRNPLVAPQVLGISPGAAFGGALAILIGWSGFALLAMAFLCGILALVLVGLVARIDGRSEIVTVILSGLVIGALFGALISLLQFVADPNGSLQAIVYWLMGSFATATWQRAALAGPGIIVGAVVLLLLRFRLNVLSLDEADARSLGTDPERERWLVFGVVALIVASQVAVAGVVGWVGLVIPHAARLIVGHDHRALLPAAALLGASFLVCVDTLARTATSVEIPLGVLTALVGAPFFAVLLRRHHRERGAA
jgi:iron complex transport system permease protein